MGATRCPGKPLIEMAGKPMVQWVFEAAARCSLLSDVLIATPDEEIVSAAGRFGARGVITKSSHPTGTDRIAEVASWVAADAYINIQGDEPLMPAETITTCAKLMVESDAPMASVYDWAEDADLENPMVVKVVTDLKDQALYFSRSLIPFVRGESTGHKKHVGLYGYTREALLDFSKWEPTPLEKSEMLEQLRFLEHGVRIQMAHAKATPLAVDTPEQARQAEELLLQGGII